MPSGAGFAGWLIAIAPVRTLSASRSSFEAFGWAATGQLIGAAAGSAVAGILIDTSGPVGAYLAAALFAVVGLIVAVVFVRSFPDLRDRDPSPHPDTETLSIPTVS